MQTITKKLIIGAVVVLILGLAVGMPVYRHAGPSFTFALPEAITWIEGKKITKHEITFPNFFPGQWYATFSATPLFNAGDVIEVDINSLKKEDIDNTYIRVIDYPTDTKNKNVSASYAFDITLWWPEYYIEGVVRLRIDDVDSDDTVVGRQKSSDSEWFWSREVYQATIID
ncbi:hypothetical protein MYX06_04535 [Patescibacteria group bacterium AH-259-L05]|nr:hypothetical protein [Patescibacteria group bacterium AH-259-L05]